MLPPTCPLFLLANPATVPHPWQWQLLLIATVGSNFQSFFLHIVPNRAHQPPPPPEIPSSAYQGTIFKALSLSSAQILPLSSWGTSSNCAALTPQRSGSQCHRSHLSSKGTNTTRSHHSPEVKVPVVWEPLLWAPKGPAQPGSAPFPDIWVPVSWAHPPGIRILTTPLLFPLSLNS